MNQTVQDNVATLSLACTMGCLSWFGCIVWLLWVDGPNFGLKNWWIYIKFTVWLLLFVSSLFLYQHHIIFVSNCIIAELLFQHRLKYSIYFHINFHTVAHILKILLISKIVHTLTFQQFSYTEINIV